MGQWNGQGQPLGFVASVTGQVSGICVNRELDVAEVPLQVGDAIYAWDQLQTGPDGALVVRLEDGSQWTLGPLASVEVDPAMMSEQPAEEPLQLALEEGIDFDALEPTAAGGGAANDDGTRVVILDRGNEADPYQAFDTPGVDTDATGGELDISDVIQPEDDIIVAGLGGTDGAQDAGEEPLERFEFSELPGGFTGGKLAAHATGGSGDLLLTKTLDIPPDTGG